jgi:uncharacterized RDD family membrane protein YckC
VINEGLGLLSAPLGRRSAAFLIDAACVVAVAVPALIGYPALVEASVSGTRSPAELIAVATVPFILVVVGTVLADILVVVQLVLHGRRGVTIGKRLLGLRSVNAESLERPGFWRVVLRALVLALAGTVVPVLGGVVLLASPLWARNTTSRGWLDLVGRTWLLDVRAGLDPFDAKALRLARKAAERAHVGAATAVPSLATGSDAQLSFVAGSRSRSSIVGGAAVGAVAGAEEAAPAPAPRPAPAGAVSEVLPPGFEPAASRPRAAPTLSAAATSATLLGHDSTRYVVEASALIGRNPTPDPAHPEYTSIIVADDSFSMSKTHAMLRADANGVWITDLGSSNGSSVLDASGVPVRLEAGTPAHVAWGGTLHLGDRAFAVYPTSRFEGVQ